MKGGCCCGHVRYCLEQAPLVVHCCHCTSCQRETGSAFAINLMIESSSVTILPPAPATLPARPSSPDTFPAAGPIPTSDHGSELIRAQIPQESGMAQTAVHCPRCFTTVWREYVFGPPIRFIMGGTLDRAWLVQPDVYIFMRSKRDFVKIGDGRRQFEEYYDRNKEWRPESLERWEKVKPQVLKHMDSLKE